MDPHANLREQLELARRITELRDSIPTATIICESDYRAVDEARADTNEDIADAADRLAELVLALDEWRRAGGFDPTEADNGPVR